MNKKYILISVVIGLLLAGAISEAAWQSYPNFFKKVSGAINSRVDTDTLGSTSNRWVKVWADAVDTTNLTVTLVTAGTIVGGDINMADNAIKYASYISAGYFTATSTAGTATTTIAGGFNVDNGVLFVDPSTNRVGINDTTPSYALDVTGQIRSTATTTVPSLRVGTDLIYADDDVDKVGIGTTTPLYKFSVVGDSYTNGTIRGSGNIVLAGSATSTFVGPIQTTLIKLTTGSALGSVLMSNANGYGTWTATSSLAILFSDMIGLLDSSQLEVTTGPTKGYILSYDGSEMNWIATSAIAFHLSDALGTLDDISDGATYVKVRSASSTDWETIDWWRQASSTDLYTAYLERGQWDGGSTNLVAATGRTSLGLDIGSDVQAWDLNLDTIAGLATTNDYIIISDGSDWTSAPTSSLHLALSGMTGTLDDIADGTTYSKVKTASTTDYEAAWNWYNASGTDLYTYLTRDDLSDNDTDDLSEGTNKYYSTQLFATDLFATTTDALSQGLTNIYWSTTTGNYAIDSRLSGGAGIGYSAGAITFDCSEVEGYGIDCVGENISLDATTTINYWLTTKTTTNLAEGTNLYFTDQRVDDVINASTTFSIDIVGNLTGNADTATALAADPADCGDGWAALGINTTGSSTCTAVWNADADIAADTISESKIIFSTACVAGSHYYFDGGNDLACEVDDGDDLSDDDLDTLQNIVALTETTGDILVYKSAVTGWDTVSSSTVGKVLKIDANGWPAWGTDADTGGAFATTTAKYFLSQRYLTDFGDTDAASSTYGNMIYWDGDSWDDISTSSLAIDCSDITNCVASAYDAISDIVLTENYILVGNNAGVAAPTSTLIVDADTGLVTIAGNLKVSGTGGITLNFSETITQSKGDDFITLAGGAGGDDTSIFFDLDGAHPVLGTDDVQDRIEIDAQCTITATTTIDEDLIVDGNGTSTFAGNLEIAGNTSTTNMYIGALINFGNGMCQGEDTSTTTPNITIQACSDF